MGDKTNYWMVLSLIFILILVMVSLNLYEEKILKYNFNGFEISKKGFNNLLDVTEFGEFQLCSIEENKCVLVTKIEDGR